MQALLIGIAALTPKFSTAQQYEKSYVIGEIVVNSTEEANPDQFYETVIEEIIFDQINEILEKKGFDKKQKNELLKLTAEDQAIYMAKIQDDELVRDEKDKNTTGERLEAYGGSKLAEELSSKTSIKSGKIPYTYAKIADDIVFKWLASSKKAKIIESLDYTLVGISVKIDESKRKVYTSMVLGNYKSFNEGPKYIDNLKLPYSKRNYGLTNSDPVFCKKVNRYENIMDLHKGLSIEGNAIYFETDDYKSFKKLINKKKDGIAIDILQKEQFSCSVPNIVDHNSLNQGILTKRIYSSKLFKNNLVESEDNSTKFKAQVAVLPEGISDDYELNLVLIKNKSACKTIPQSFLIKSSGTYTRKIKLLADTVTINSKFQYKPIADSMQLCLRIPFENKKHTYHTEDIEPFLKLLNDPAFLIYDLQITAYSSIEGTDSENKRLQQQRAESIISALEDRQKELISTKLITDYNWSDFKKDVQKTKHSILASMKMEEAQAYIRSYNLNKELEPILQNHRYAQIDMKVTFDIEGENEKPYVLKKFKKAITENDRILALSIQKYIMKKVLSYQYNPAILTQLDIPCSKAYSGLKMNNLWLQQFTNQISQEEFALNVEQLQKLNPNNEYIAFNDLFLKVTKDAFPSDAEANALQTRIDRLYFTPLKKETIDALNIKLQFKLITFADSTNTNEKVKKECITRIKQIVDIHDETLENSLKLAELFIENSDYTFALKTLEPWVYNPNVNEELLFTYLSLCSRFEMRMHTQKFNYALERSRELNAKRFCELFNGDYFSLKVFENNFVKDNYCKFCIIEDKMVLE
ncbi:MAG: hypothetical protein PF517_14615 [Salinivirgaceae bacterium]|nr:hypothetical protein [Salinivirgaceae bacterium]